MNGVHINGSMFIVNGASVFILVLVEEPFSSSEWKRRSWGRLICQLITHFVLHILCNQCFLLSLQSEKE